MEPLRAHPKQRRGTSAAPDAPDDLATKCIVPELGHHCSGRREYGQIADRLEASLEICRYDCIGEPEPLLGVVPPGTRGVITWMRDTL